MFRSFRGKEIREEGIYVCTDDRRCVKTSFARLLPDYHLSFRAGAPSGGDKNKLVEERKRGMDQTGSTGS